MGGRLPLTARGWFLLAVGVALCVTGWTMREAPLLWPGVFLTALAPLGWLTLRLLPPAVRVQRTVQPAELPAGTEAVVDLTLSEERPALAWALEVTEALPPSFGGARTLRVATPGRGVDVHESYRIRPGLRGRFLLDQLAYAFVDPLGLARRSVRPDGGTEIIVTPRLIPLGRVDPAVSGRTGETPIPHLAFQGDDDVLIREYRPRDDVRRIHWPSTARTGTLMVRREEQAWDPVAQVILDNRAEVYGRDAEGRDRFEWAVSVAASVGVALLDAGYDVTFASASGVEFTSQRLMHGSPSQRLLRQLADTVQADHPTLTGALQSVGRGPSGHLVVAVLGRLGATEAHDLAALGDSQHRCWALYLPTTEADEQAALPTLEDHDWRFEPVAPHGDVAAAWRALNGRGRQGR